MLAKKDPIEQIWWKLESIWTQNQKLGLIWQLGQKRHFNLIFDCYK